MDPLQRSLPASSEKQTGGMTPLESAGRTAGRGKNPVPLLPEKGGHPVRQRGDSDSSDGRKKVNLLPDHRGRSDLIIENREDRFEAGSIQMDRHWPEAEIPVDFWKSGGKGSARQQFIHSGQPGSLPVLAIRWRSVMLIFRASDPEFSHMSLEMIDPSDSDSGGLRCLIAELKKNGVQEIHRNGRLITVEQRV